MMERVEAQCRKCDRVFSTAAQTRTTCPGCKAAVSVRRDATWPSMAATVEGEIDAVVLVVALSVAAVAWAGWRAWKWWREHKWEPGQGAT